LDEEKKYCCYRNVLQALSFTRGYLELIGSSSEVFLQRRCGV